MKKNLILFTLTLLSLHVCAQTNVIVKEPNVERFAIIQADGVNLRKATNAQSQKLMYKEEEVYANCFWGAPNAKAKGYSIYPAQPAKGEVYPILSENGDWLQILYNTENKPYLKQQFCQIKTSADLKEITQADLSDRYLRQTGAFKDWCFERFEDPEAGDNGIRLGLKKGKYIVFAYLARVIPLYDPKLTTAYRIEKKKACDDCMEEWILYFGKSVATNIEKLSDTEWYAQLDISKFTDKQLAEVFTKAPGEGLDTQTVFLKFKGDSELHMFEQKTK